MKFNKKCESNFTTQYAYINNNTTQIHIDDYDEKLNYIPKCKNGHELIFCNGKKNKKHFKHKNQEDISKDSNMSEWHCRMQGYFKNTEIVFSKNNENQLKKRIADVVLNNEYILEIQHSEISDESIKCRYDDYKINNKKVIWFIDGNTNDVKLYKLSDNTYIIKFKNEWKYKSFKHIYDYILLDIDDKIFKISVKLVCNKYFHAKDYKNINDVVNTLKNNPEKIWKLWTDTNEVKPCLKIKQQGAGNGKTYGIWKDISLNFDKELYIIITKQHTAKNVILCELNSQAERKEYHIINNMKEIEEENVGKQFIVNYKHKYSKKKCKVIIGTVDSFIYCLTNHSINGETFFDGMVNNICKNGCDKMNKYTGEVRYAKISIKLNLLTELWIDESQDLKINYCKAFINKIIPSTKIDCIVVGDKLQTLKYEKNFMIFHQEDINKDDIINNINIIKETPKNINRRIKVKGMVEKINNLVNFKKYNLPKISIENNEELEDIDYDPIEIFKQKKIYANDTNQEKVDDEVYKIINIVDNEVEKHNYKPEDFLFIFPMLKSNTFACELETELNKYWLKKYGHNKKYNQYAVLHKHEEGQVINTKKSEYATRIMSITASKGDGRNVVFILSCTEKSLKMVSNNEINLLYESHFHVALTRAKRKIYFGLQYNNDNIHKRFADTDQNIEYIPNINIKLNIDKITKYTKKNKIIELLKNNNVNDMNEENKENNITIKKIIDWEYHCIRHSVYYIYSLFEIFNYNKDKDIFKKSQLKVVLDKISNLPVESVLSKDFYKYLKEKNICEDLDYFPVCELSNKKIYKKYCKKIIKIIQTIQNNYKNNYLSLGELKPLECSILVYTIHIFQQKKFHTITPSTIYNIIDSFKKKDNISELIEESKYIKKIVNNLMSDILKNNNNIEWNLEHYVCYDGNTKEIKLQKRFSPIIGNDKKNVYHIVFQTDYNKLNYWDTMIKILLERFILKNANSNEHEKNNKFRFTNKKITTYLCILKHNKYEIFNWDFENNISNDLKILCKDAFLNYFQSYNLELFNYCKYIKNNKSKWEDKFKSPYQFISKHEKFENKSYVIDFFNYLHNRSINDRKYKEVKEITDNELLFNDKINEYIEEMIDIFFGLNEKDNKINENIEW